MESRKFCIFALSYKQKKLHLYIPCWIYPFLTSVSPVLSMAAKFSHPLYEKLKSKTFVLASTSPRRREILQKLGIQDFKIMGSNFEEDLDKSKYSVDDYVLQTATYKGLSVLSHFLQSKDSNKDFIILASDTIVECEGIIYEKPSSKIDQFEKLKHIKDCKFPIYVKTAVVIFSRRNSNDSCENNWKKYGNITDVNILKDLKIDSHLESTKLTMDYENLDDSFLQLYVDSNEGAGAAGGFQIQGMGGLLFSKIEGDYNNVVGLPFTSTWRLIEKCLQ
ncbi:nucleotide diphosphatase [Saccharomycopsis crataegensis]|uniref:Nucleotide diphosphatase n=1 Tax=Saccharomycopsis crataegensis TaxID=43959 RepID=A0AAV5QV89_9ASCO|nr:nucleotide diphosphatase [Saccharomycopsis crataegensis]